jgi:AIG2-like family
MSTTARHWYFAYGSNMQTATFQGRRGIAFSRAVAARAPGWRLALDKPPLVSIGESFANIVADAAAEALGVLYEVGEDDLEHIDLTEGVKIDNYRRIEIAVLPLAAPGEEWRAHTLVSDRRDASLRPSRRYMSCLIAGAQEHGLPVAYVAWLRAVEVGEESEEARRLRPLLDGFMKRRARP